MTTIRTTRSVQLAHRPSGFPGPDAFQLIVLCCPQGGPSVVTFILNGTSVQAKGQFPPDN
ncbi:hypothetical protein OG874_25870 [Nocardia sp. NBC_00565]|uniref:hypothetical protein n=1 Tax=Nocardia sp. NBC_00565 TaxID=2975993 RepID=UPI002E801F24|nr:hypothetical protein [Nocardia sp. NBC_00565]WUC00318.1 hypothetical protein OG874_25870 [Nocardia sp. NBC_00565]